MAEPFFASVDDYADWALLAPGPWLAAWSGGWDALRRPMGSGRRGAEDAYDRDLRPGLVTQVIADNQAAGVEPSIWKIEGLESTDAARSCRGRVLLARWRLWSAEQQPGGELELVAHVVGRRPPGHPGDQAGQPDVADHPGDRDLVGGRLALVHGPGQHPLHQPRDRVDLGRRARVGEHERPGHGLGEHRLALHGAGDPAQYEQHPLVRRVAGN